VVACEQKIDFTLVVLVYKSLHGLALPTSLMTVNSSLTFDVDILALTASRRVSFLGHSRGLATGVFLRPDRGHGSIYLQRSGGEASPSNIIDDYLWCYCLFRLRRILKCAGCKHFYLIIETLLNTEFPPVRLLTLRQMEWEVFLYCFRGTKIATTFSSISKKRYIKQYHRMWLNFQFM